MAKAAHIHWHTLSTCVAASNGCFSNCHYCVPHESDGCDSFFPTAIVLLVTAAEIKDAGREVVIAKVFIVVPVGG